MPTCEICSHPLVIEVTAGFAGTAFGPDGFALDELTPVWQDAVVVCDSCRHTESFGDWQERTPAAPDPQPEPR